MFSEPTLRAGEKLRTVLYASGAFALSLAFAASHGAFAQSAAPGSVVVLEPLAVEGEQESAEETAKRRLDAIPGGTALVTSDDLDNVSGVSIADALKYVPGLAVQNFFGGNDQPRVQIRGSGLQQNPVERGVLTLQDGLPLNRADGSYIVGLANLKQAEMLEVYRGYSANRLGAAVLGGALNFVSPTGSSSPGAALSLMGGSFGQFNANLQAGAREENVDGLISVDYSRRDGFRDYNESERVSVDMNSGVEISDFVTTRFFIGYTDLSFDVAGPLTRDALYNNRRSSHAGPVVVSGVGTNPGPNVLRDRPQREAEQFRIGNRTTVQIDAHLLDLALGYSRTTDQFRFPISAGVRETDSDDVTFVSRYAYSPDAESVLPLFEANLRYAIGWAERSYYLNRSGRKGDLFGRNDLDAQTLALNAGFNVPIGHDVTVSPAVTFTYASRDNDDTYGGSTRPTIAYRPNNPTAALADGSVATTDNSYSRSYSGVSPSLGVSWRPYREQLVFGAISRSFEPPTHDDLLSTINGTPNSSPGRPTPTSTANAEAFHTPNLDAQTATTLEAGWRGGFGPAAFDLVVYHSWIKNEILSLRDTSGNSLGAMNADKTRHFGVELGGNFAIADDLALRLAYTYQDFRFHNDPLRGDNRLAGAPRHIVNAALSYNVTPDIALQTNVEWRPGKTPVDNMNTVYADSWVLVGLRAAWSVTDRFSLFGEVRNLFDETYASSTLVVDQARADQALYQVGDGRAFYAGLKVKF